MGSLFMGGAVLLTLLVICSPSCLASRYLANDSYTYRLKFPDGSPCMTVSMNAQIIIFYRTLNTTDNSTLTNEQFDLPPKSHTTVNSTCTNSTRILYLSWFNGNSMFEAIFNFSVGSTNWYLAQVNVGFDLDASSFNSPDVHGFQSYATTDGEKMFNRTFGVNQYFYCKACKRLWLRGDNNNTGGNDTGPCYTESDKGPSCSHVYLQNSVLFPGDLDNNTHVSKKLCLEDLIDLQEIIIPAAVGGILGLLLLVIFSAYLVAFIRRKRREGQYETINEAY